jgi:hypothetical protein
MLKGLPLAPIEAVGGGLQLTGAFGEWSVVAELLRRGWNPANVNQTIRNNKGVDILAIKGDRKISISVKTHGPSQRKWQVSGFLPGKEIQVPPPNNVDFMIFVSMGRSRSEDAFYILPLHKAMQEVNDRRQNVMKRVPPPKDIGHWSIMLDSPKNFGLHGRPGEGLAVKWKPYLNKWDSLETG